MQFITLSAIGKWDATIFGILGGVTMTIAFSFMIATQKFHFTHNKESCCGGAGCCRGVLLGFYLLFWLSSFANGMIAIGSRDRTFAYLNTIHGIIGNFICIIHINMYG